MSALETLTGDPVPNHTTTDLILVFAEQLPKELELWAHKRGLLLEKSTQVEAGAAAIRARSPKWTIIDLDVQPGERDPVALVKGLRAHAPETAIVAVSSRADELFTRALINAGVKAVVIKRAPTAELALALISAAEGKSYVSGERTRADASLTPREQQILELMAKGLANREIAAELKISVKTVEAHRSRVFAKLGASNAADAIMLAIRAGLLIP